MRKKILSVILSVCFSISGMTSFVYAEEGSKEAETTEETSKEEMEQTEATEKVVEEEEDDGESIPESKGEGSAQESSETTQQQEEKVEEISFDNEKPETEEELIEEKEEIQEQDYSAGETDVSNFKYTNSDGKITITKYIGSGTEVVIPSIINGYPVTVIGDSAFKNFRSLTSITIPESVTSIGKYAFQYCSGLTSITVPESVTDIGTWAFYGCTGLKTAGPIGGGYDYEFGWETSIPKYAFEHMASLTSITVPESVTDIGFWAFYGCTGLKTAGPIGGGYDYEFGWKTSIPSNAFSECTDLTSITIPDGVTSIPANAFSSCSGLTSITIPGNVTDIGYSAFSGCTGIKTAGPIGSGADYEYGWTETIPENAFCGLSELNHIVIPESITSIGSPAFSDCSKLKTAGPIGGEYDFEFGWKTSIPERAFFGCNSLTSITIPDSVTSIGDGAFSNCTDLTNITIPESVTSIGGYAFYNCSGLTGITIPDSVTSIREWTFSGCTGLTSFTIPDNVTSIGEAAFSGCTGLTSVTIPDSVTDIGNSPFSSCTGLKTAGPIGGGFNCEFGWKTSIPASIFYGCTGLTNIVIPDSAASIGEWAFCDCTSLTSVIIPESVTSIGDAAFFKCSDLTSVTISDGVTSIGEAAFESCTGLTDITIPDSVTSIGKWAFYDCTGLTSITIPNGVTSIGIYAFWGCASLTTMTVPSCAFEDWDRIFKDCNITDITIADGVTELPAYAFRRFDTLKHIVIPESVTRMDGSVFFGWSGLKTAGPIGGGYDCEFGWKTSIPSNAFSECTDLTSITIPDGITSIGDYAFYDCSSLTSITIPESVTSIGWDAFRNCTGLTSITIPDSVTSIGEAAFESCTGLTSITISNSVTSIPERAFSGCTGLTSITIPGGVTRIESSAFADCSSLNEVRFDGTEAEWNEIEIESNNDPLLNAKKIFLKTSPTSINIVQGASIEMPTSSNKSLTINAVPADASSNVTWVSSNEKVAEVDKNGTVTAKTYGKTTITAVSKANSELKAEIIIQTRFHDVNDSTQSYYKPVYWGADNGVVAGFNGGEYFGPDDDCTRAQFVTFLWRLAGKPSGTKDVSFPDVDSSANYFRAVKWAVSRGIIVGFKHDNAPATFEPDGLVTRGQVATMLWRYAGKQTPELPSTSPFTDINSSNSAYRAVVWGQKAGVIKGYKDGTFQPDGSCLRQHIVTFLYRYARDVMHKKVN